jgi:hypothetical protein
MSTLQRVADGETFVTCVPCAIKFEIEITAVTYQRIDAASESRLGVGLPAATPKGLDLDALRFAHNRSTSSSS